MSDADKSGPREAGVRPGSVLSGHAHICHQFEVVVQGSQPLP